jgi:hypothetical protein
VYFLRLNIVSMKLCCSYGLSKCHFSRRNFSVIQRTTVICNIFNFSSLPVIHLWIWYYFTKHLCSLKGWNHGQTSCLSGHMSCLTCQYSSFIFEKSHVQILVQRPGYLPNAFHCFPQTLQANAKIVTVIRPHSLSSMSFLMYYLLTILIYDAI